MTTNPPDDGLLVGKLVRLELTMANGVKYVMPIDQTVRFSITQPAPEPIRSDGRFTEDGYPGIVGYYPPKYIEVEIVGRMYRPHQITLVKETPNASEEERSMGKQS